MKKEDEILKEINDYQKEIDILKSSKNNNRFNKRIFELKNNIEILNWVLDKSNFLPF